MRKEFAQSIIQHFETHPSQVFLTGDLGFMALEDVRARFQERFINTGIAEQNMVTVAASLAYEGFTTWVYSIGPFVTLRPYEQLRNDVCLHNLPVKVVGNGGGYGYGIMGATHHNLEDIGAMRLLPNMKVVVPLLGSDVEEAIVWMLNDPSPNYLRLNLAATFPEPIAPFAQWRKIKEGKGAVVIGTGPVLGNLTNLPKDLYDQLEIWAISIFPIDTLPQDLIKAIEMTKKVVTLEEHKGQGGLNEALAPLLIKNIKVTFGYTTLFAQGYPSGRYGDQKWHLEENGLAGEKLASTIQEVLTS